MFGWVPLSGTAFLAEASPNRQLAHWARRAPPSPLIGFARDGFPIYGPYDAHGNLQIALGSDGATLDECNFNFSNQVYHITPNFPWTPSCFVGTPGSYKEATTRHGFCPIRGAVNTYCKGTGCAPKCQECTDGEFEFPFSAYWWTAFVAQIIILAIVVAYELTESEENAHIRFPVHKPLKTVTPAFILFVCYPLIFSLFGYKGDASDSLNVASAAYLTVTGVMYGLVVSSIFTK